MAQPRVYEYDTTVTTATQPNAGTPSLSSDLLTLGYLQGAYSGKPAVTGTKASPSAIVAGTGIAFAGVARDFFHTWFIQGSGGAVDVSANPQIAAGTAVGQKLRLIGCSDTNTVNLNDGTGLKLSAADRLLSEYSVLELEWDGSNWVEAGWNNI